MKEAIEIWFKFYEDKTGMKYRFTGKDGIHLKQILKHLEGDLTTFEELLYSIRNDFVLDNLEISMVNMKLNSLLQQMTAKPKGRSFPDVYNPAYEKTLEGNSIMQYHKHLISLGWKKEVSPAGYTNWKGGAEA